MKEIRDIQTKVLSLLALEKEKGKEILSFDFIKNYLGLEAGQLAQAKRMLSLKGCVFGEEGELSLKSKYAYQGNFHQILKPKYMKRRYCKICSHLTKDLFCPVKKVYIDQKHYRDVCSCTEYPHYKYLPTCKGWMLNSWDKPNYNNGDEIDVHDYGVCRISDEGEQTAYLVEEKDDSLNWYLQPDNDDKVILERKVSFIKDR